MEYGPFWFFTLFLSIITVGGGLGGFLQAMRATTSYKVRKSNRFKHDDDILDNNQTSKVEYWDLGGYGFVYAGIITAFMAIGLLTMSGSADFSAVSKHAFKSKGNNINETVIKIPIELFSNIPLENAEVINNVVKVIVKHNLAQENNSINGADNAFWTWIKMFAFSILSGFGGVGLVSSAYNRYVGEEELNDIQQKVDKEYESTKKNTLEIQLQRARELILNNQLEDAIEICDEILTSIYPCHPRAMGIKARALSRLQKLSEAIDLLEQALCTADMSNAVKARMYWNIACYKTLSKFGDGLPIDLDSERIILSEIETNLKCAIKFDSHLKLKLPDKDDNLTVLVGVDWFDKLST